MAKWVCNVCGYVYEGENAPEVCPICKAPAEKFTKQSEEMAWAAEHVVGVAKGVSHGPFEIVDKDVPFILLMNDGKTRPVVRHLSAGAAL